MMSVEKEFGSVKSLLMHVLKNYPDTRESDNKLFIQSCRVLGAETLEDVEKVGLNIITVHKMRQIIQNKDGMYLPEEKILKQRHERSIAIKNYIVAN